LHILSIPPIWILPLKRFGAVPINTYSFLAFYSIYVDFPVETLFNPAGFSRPFYSVYAEFTVETDPGFASSRLQRQFSPSSTVATRLFTNCKFIYKVNRPPPSPHSSFGEGMKNPFLYGMFQVSLRFCDLPVRTS